MSERPVGHARVVAIFVIAAAILLMKADPRWFGLVREAKVYFLVAGGVIGIAAGLWLAVTSRDVVQQTESQTSAIVNEPAPQEQKRLWLLWLFTLLTMPIFVFMVMIMALTLIGATTPSLPLLTIVSIAALLVAGGAVVYFRRQKRAGNVRQGLVVAASGAIGVAVLGFLAGVASGSMLTALPFIGTGTVMLLIAMPRP